MFKFDKSDLQRIAVSSVGAVALSAACIFGVSAPAHAGTVKEWKASVEQQLDLSNVGAQTAAASDVKETDLTLRFTAEGDYAGATVAKSSGDKRLDQRAIETVAAMDIPSLPASDRARTVKMRLLHDAPINILEAERAKDNRTVNYALAGGGSIKVAAK